MAPLPPEYNQTRQSLHMVAEHILGAASYAAIGKIGLRANESGFSTQDMNGTMLTVTGPFLTDGQRSLVLGGSTLQGVADWAGIVGGAPATVYAPATPHERHEPLVVDGPCAVMVGEWFAGMQGVLSHVIENEPDASPLQLWPEHFDLATDMGDAAEGKRANFGASPGDTSIPEPYIYVGPWDTTAVRENEPKFFFTHEWGTAMPYSELIKASDPLAAAAGFFQRHKRMFV